MLHQVSGCTVLYTNLNEHQLNMSEQSPLIPHTPTYSTTVVETLTASDSQDVDSTKPCLHLMLKEQP